jgi:hypothetical protein
LSIAHQSPGCFPKAVYIAIQMTRKRMPAEISGSRWLRVHFTVLERFSPRPGPAGEVDARTRHQIP